MVVVVDGSCGGRNSFDTVYEWLMKVSIKTKFKIMRRVVRVHGDFNSDD